MHRRQALGDLCTRNPCCISGSSFHSSENSNDVPSPAPPFCVHLISSLLVQRAKRPYDLLSRPFIFELGAGPLLEMPSRVTAIWSYGSHGHWLPRSHTRTFSSLIFAHAVNRIPRSSYSTDGGSWEGSVSTHERSRGGCGPCLFIHIAGCRSLASSTYSKK